MLDMDASQIPANFMRNWIITGLLVCFVGYLCISGFPRAAGKSLLRSMPGLGSDDASYEHQSLAATIAIMIGADSGFRKIMESAMGDFYAVSMEDVAWCACFPALHSTLLTSFQPALRRRDDLYCQCCLLPSIAASCRL
jgi:hypothetical protein